MENKIDGKDLINWILHESRIHKPLVDAIEITPLIQKIKQLQAKESEPLEQAKAEMIFRAGGNKNDK